ncbi:MAG: hypothetical protein AAGD96_15530 [Chloroflexota bacterium]
MTETKKERRRRIRKWIVRGLLGFVLAISFLPLIGGVIACRVLNPPDVAYDEPRDRSVTDDIEYYYRGEDQSYLTVPEWYIVFNADEFGAFLKTGRTSQFPWFRAIYQFWETYYAVCRQTGNNYPYNGRYQQILLIIGPSFTVENSVRALYAKTISRAAEWTNFSGPTQEEIYYQQVQAEYGAFLHTVPWFKFPFQEKRQGLWSETDLIGRGLIRKWERKLAISTEYLIKSTYGYFINQGAEASFGFVPDRTFLWVSGFSDELLEAEPDLTLVKPLENGEAIVNVPRYEAFTVVVPRLAKSGLQFLEIAGNDEIVMAVLVDQTWEYNLAAGDVFLEQTYLSRPELKRLVITVPVEELHTVLLQVAEQDLVLEHLYDY